MSNPQILLGNQNRVKWLAMSQDSQKPKMIENNAIKIISLNIEKDRHILEVLEFLNKENADVICLQEIFSETFELFKEKMNMFGVFDPQATFKNDNGEILIQGVAILSKSPVVDSKAIIYSEEVKDVYELSLSYHPEKDADKGAVNRQYSRNLLTASIQNEKTGSLKIATTHFTWGYYGYVDKETKEFVWDLDDTSIKQQIDDAERLLKILDNLDEVIFCVDSNAPRGYKVFDLFAEKLKDNIPKEYTTSIDGNIHRAGHLPLMVDGIFTTPKHNAKNVVLKNGISDHMAVVCEISK